MHNFGSKTSLCRHGCKWEDNVKMNVLWWHEMNRFYLEQCSLEDFCGHCDEPRSSGMKFLDQLDNYQLFKEYCPNNLVTLNFQVPCVYGRCFQTLEAFHFSKNVSFEMVRIYLIISLIILDAERHYHGT